MAKTMYHPKFMILSEKQYALIEKFGFKKGLKWFGKKKDYDAAFGEV